MTITPPIPWQSQWQRFSCAAVLVVCLCTGCNSTRFGAIENVDAVGDTRVVRAAAQESVIEPNTQPIDLATALSLAGAGNPTIALAEEAVRARRAEHLQARALLFPTLQAGGNVRVHRGNLLTSRGLVADRDIQSLYYGFGADTRGAGTVAVPGVRVVSHLADAYYAPQAARERVIASRFDADNTNNYILMEVGVRYLELVEAEARRTAYQQSLKEVAEVERLTANFAKAGQGRDSDAQRARAEAFLLRGDIERMHEEVAVAAAELARLLDLDPSDRLRPVDPAPPILEMVDRDAPLSALLDEALRAHPEIVARAADVNFQAIRLRQERVRPLLPLVAIGFSAGEFGGGNQSTAPGLRDFSDRIDLDVVAVWSLQNLGMGNRAVQNVARTNVEMAYLEQQRVIERVRNEVAEAHAFLQARNQEMAIARKRVEIAQRAYTQDLRRIQNLQGLPLEVLASANQLAAARQDLVRAIIGYSQAQLRLHAALGQAPR